jgi:putative intracellular protease/amidase
MKTTTLWALGLAVLASGCAASTGDDGNDPNTLPELPNEDDFVSGGKADFGGTVSEDMGRWRKANEARWSHMEHCASMADCDVLRPIASEKNGKTVLVAITSVEQFRVWDTKAEQATTFPTGYFVRELIDTLEALLEDGYEVEFTTLDGQAPRVDENGQNPLWFSLPSRFTFKGEKRANVARQFIEAQIAGRGVLTLEQAIERVDGYSGIVIPGGHGPMEDFPESVALGQILDHMHAAGKPTGMICHAPIAMLATREKVAAPEGEWMGWDFEEDPSWIYSGYRVATASTAEEDSVRWFGYLPNELHVSYYVDQELEQAGVTLVQNPIPSWAMAIHDRELVTGQNPWSSHYFAEAFIEALALASQPE